MMKGDFSESPPLLVMYYDDGDDQIWTKAKPVHDQYDVPAVVSLPVRQDGRIGSRPMDSNPDIDGYLTADEVRSLEDNGWEISGHGLESANLGSYNVTTDPAAGSTSIEIETNGRKHLHALIDQTYVIEDASNSEEITVTGIDGANWVLASGLSNSYTGAIVQMTSATGRYYMATHKKFAEQLGVTVSNYAYPQGSIGSSGDVWASHFFDSARATGAPGDPAQDRPIDPYSHGALDFSNMTSSELTTYLDDVANNNRLGQLFAHTWDDTVSQSEIETVITEAQSRDIRIVTLREALSFYSPDMYGGITAYRDSDGRKKVGLNGAEVVTGFGYGNKQMEQRNDGAGSYWKLAGSQDYRVFDAPNDVWRLVADTDRVETELSRRKMPVLSSPPSNPEAGDYYIDNGTNTSSNNMAMRIYDGSVWVDQN